MKKRLRKKCHLGEFTQWGCQFVITLKSADVLDVFLKDFLSDALEANDCSCSGEVYEDKLNVVVELGSRTETHATKMQAIKTWIDGRTDVQDYKTGDVFDLWYDNYEDLEEQVG